MLGAIFKRRVSKTTALLKTALTQFHIDHGGNMVSYAGFSVPKNYKEGPIKEHLACRNESALFDTSYMGQYIITGADREEFIKNFTPISFPYKPDNSLQRTLITNEDGGIDDDCVVTSRLDDSLLLVVNGTRRQHDEEQMQEQLEIFKIYEKNVEIRKLDGWSLLAFQGPKSANILNELCHKSITKLPFMKATANNIDGTNVWISRSGITGEDGFEISIEKPSDAVRIAQILVEKKGAHLAGLTARNTLRVEAGISQYGSELNEKTTLLEAGLENLVSNERKEGFPPFCGGTKILAEIKDPKKARDLRLSGILFDSSIYPEKGAKIFNDSGRKEIGFVTSGVFSPVLQKGIAIAYLKTFYANHGKPTRVLVEINKKKCPATITKMPFIPTRYYRG